MLSRRHRLPALVAAALIAGCTQESGGSSTQATTTGATPSTMPSLAAGCRVPHGVDLGALGVSGATQDQLARNFSGVILGDKQPKLNRVNACAIDLAPSGTRLEFAAPGARQEAAALARASSFTEDEAPSVSVRVTNGKMLANTPITCGPCRMVEARVVAHDGATAARSFPPRADISITSPSSWTQRGLLLRFLGGDGSVQGVLLIALPDGDFAAG